MLPIASFVRSTGAQATELLGMADPLLHEGTDPAMVARDNRSVVATEYTSRGRVRKVGGSYGELISSIVHEADDLVSEMVYGTPPTQRHRSPTTTEGDSVSAQTYRGPPSIWKSPHRIPAGTTLRCQRLQHFQLLLQDQDVTYDAVDNPTEIRDGESLTNGLPAQSP